MIQSLTLGPITFHFYGLILGTAMVVGWWYAGKIVRAQRIEEKVFDRLFIFALVGGVIGARLYHVIDYWSYYQNHLMDIVAVWKGGLGIWGAVGGGAISLIFNFQFSIFNKSKKLLWIILDAAASALPLAQAIGRWGNFVNNELFGKPTDLPWKLFIPEENRPIGYSLSAYYHPLFLYESILNVVLFLVLRLMLKRGWLVGSGKFLGGYLIGYGMIRFALEPLRISDWIIGPVNTAQLFGLLAIGVGVVIIRIRKLKYSL